MLSGIYQKILERFGEGNLETLTVTSETLSGYGQSVEMFFKLTEPLYIEMASTNKYDNEWVAKLSMGDKAK